MASLPRDARGETIHIDGDMFSIWFGNRFSVDVQTTSYRMFMSCEVGETEPASVRVYHRAWQQDGPAAVITCKRWAGGNNGYFMASEIKFAYLLASETLLDLSHVVLREQGAPR